jgi:hypothetical protein
MGRVWEARARRGARRPGEPEGEGAAFVLQIERKPIMPIILWLLGVPLVVVLLLMLTGFV